MIVGYFHQGSGLGNQLHRYVATRVRAADLGVDFGMAYVPDGSGKENGFKGKSFMPIDWGTPTTIPIDCGMFTEKKVVENGVDIRSYDPEFNFVEDNTCIDGEFQDERYWAHREKEVNEWLKVEPLDMPDDLCVVGFRGGEYYAVPDLGLPAEYFAASALKMLEINRQMKFEIHTDDPAMAYRMFFGQLEKTRRSVLPADTKIIQDIGLNWRSMRYAKYAIIANSSFYILPRWLNKGLTIAPRYWARRNTGVWALPQNYYSRFTYI